MRASRIRTALLLTGLLPALAGGCAEDGEENVLGEEDVAEGEALGEEEDLGEDEDEGDESDTIGIEQLGDEVTVDGEVIEIVDPQAFRVASERAGRTLLVVTATEHGVDEGSIVQATGLLGEMDVELAEEELGTDLDGALLEPYLGDLVVFADLVEE